MPADWYDADLIDALFVQQSGEKGLISQFKMIKVTIGFERYQPHNRVIIGI